MPGTTPLGYPYPLPGDATDGPAALKALADAVDASVTATLAAAAAAAAPKGALIRNITAQQILNNTVTTLSFGSEVFDNDNMSDLVAFPQGLTVRTAGVYHLQASWSFAANATGFRKGFITVNGASIAQTSIPASTSATFPTSYQNGSLRNLSVGQTIGLQVSQLAGVTLPLSFCQLSAHMVSP